MEETIMFRLLLQELRFRRNAIIGWCVGLSFLPLLYVSLYPSFEGQLASMQELLDLPIYQSMGMSFGTFEDWIASTVTTLIPVILSIYAVIDGTGTLAGEEEDGRLEMIVTLPIPRWQIVAVKALAHGIALFLILVVSALVSAGVYVAIREDITTLLTDLTPWDVFIALISAWPVVFSLGMLSMFLGTFTATRRFASTIGTVIVLVSYFAGNIAGQVESVENLRYLSLFNYYTSDAAIFTDGQAAGDVAVLAGVAIVAFALAVFFFNRRNITVGAWPWQRAVIT
jgi:ABC-2 type transport system permease protein